MSKQETPLQRLIALIDILIREEQKEMAICSPSASVISRHDSKINAYYSVLELSKSILPYEREVIENFGKEMQTIDYVCGNGIYHDVRFTFEPKELFTQTFQTNE